MEKAKSKALIKAILFVVLFLGTMVSQAFVASNSKAKLVLYGTSVYNLDADLIKTKSTEELGALIGKQLTIKEKIALRLIKHKLNKHPDFYTKTAINDLKMDGFVIAGAILLAIGLITLILIGFNALILLGTILGYVGLIRIKRKPEKRKGLKLAKITTITGTIVLSLLAIFVVILLLSLNSY